MSDMMTFPETWEEFEKIYGFDDSEEVYTNGSRLIPLFRVKQWLDHIAHLESKRQATVSSDLINLQRTIDVIKDADVFVFYDEDTKVDDAIEIAIRAIKGSIITGIKSLPSAESVKAYTKADYIMALHKEYGCTLTMAEEAHNKALEYLRSKARMKG